jgi:translation initiation factor IF-2
VRRTADPGRPGVLVITALAVIALPVITALTVLLTAPPASARPAPGRCQPAQPCGSTGTSGGPTACPPWGIQVSWGGSTGGSEVPWVPGPCPVSAPAPKPARTTRPAPRHARRPVPKVLVPVPPPVTVPAVVTPVTQAARPPGPRPRPSPRPRPAVFQAALEGEPATTYTPGRPVMPIGVLITVVLTPCVITVSARLGRLLSGR